MANKFKSTADPTELNGELKSCKRLPSSKVNSLALYSVTIKGYPIEAELTEVENFFKMMGKQREGFPQRDGNIVVVAFQCEKDRAYVIKSIATSLIIGGHVVQLNTVM